MQEGQRFDLVTRTRNLGIAVIRLIRNGRRDYVLRIIHTQLLRSATSVGANYSEADASSTRKDYIYKVSLSNKEVKETIHWLHMLKSASDYNTLEIEELLDESVQINKILSSIIIKMRRTN